MAFNIILLDVLNISEVAIDIVELRDHLAICRKQEHLSLLLITRSEQQGFA